MTKDVKPKFRHDCKSCTFLGHINGGFQPDLSDENGYDLYFCPQGMLPTVIARFSDLGPDYTSGAQEHVNDPVLHIALVKAFRFLADKYTNCRSC